MKKNNYRKGVGAIILNNKKQVFMAERLDKKDAWQLPQGGIESNENEEQAIFRELLEEIGTNNVEILYKLPMMHYNFPDNIKISSFDNKYIGQEIVWFVMIFKGKEEEINLNYSVTNIEFSRWKWEDSNKIAKNIVSFKKAMYKEILKYLN